MNMNNNTLNDKIMKKIVLTIIAALALGFAVSAQEVSNEEWRNMSRKERKEYKLQEAIKKQEATMALLNSKQWVLEAIQLQLKSGETFMLEPNLNFVGVQNEVSTVQLGSSGDIGLNGVGGITIDGNVRKYDLKENKKPGTGAYLRIEVMGASAGHVTISIRISPDGTADATLTNNFGDRLTYRGRIMSIAESSAYKGTVTY